MSKESYVNGFCKAAAAAGVNPVSLIKFAQNGPAGTGPLKGNAAREAVRGAFDKGHIIKMDTPKSVRAKEWLHNLLPWTSDWQYLPNNPGYMIFGQKPGVTEAIAVPSPLRVAQTLEQNPQAMTSDDAIALSKVKDRRPISLYEESQMIDSVQRANPEAAHRISNRVIGTTAERERSAVRGLTEALSEGAASGKIKIPSARRVGVGNLNVLSRLGKLLRLK